MSPPVERAILVGVPRKRSSDRRQVEEHLEELARLADTAGAIVAGQVVQQLERPNPATYVGKGKVDELIAAIAAAQATLVIFDDELTPAQGKNLEDALGTRVIDRAELILDIFALRARSSEAKMQVELAQLEYSLPRLKRMWTHLERYRGGIGVRGPGETQLETDRRLINRRIGVLRERLDDVKRARAIQRGTRAGAFRASLVGYTNAGKSSILRGLANAPEVVVEDRLFATLDPLTREVALGDHKEGHVLLTDTVGFIRKLPHDLVASFRATLEEVREADVLLHVIDASHPSWEEQRDVVHEVLEELDVVSTPVIEVFNKIDRMDAAVLGSMQERATVDGAAAVFVSAVQASTGGLEPLRRALLAAVRARHPVTEIRLSHADGALLARIHRSGEVLDQRSDGEEMVIRARVDARLAAGLRRDGARVTLLA